MGTEHPTLLVQLESGIRIIRDIRNAGTLPLTGGAVVIERIDQPAKRSGLFALVAHSLTSVPIRAACMSVISHAESSNNFSNRPSEILATFANSLAMPLTLVTIECRLPPL